MATRQRPRNVLLILADQFRFDAIAAHGNPHVNTPGLDRLIATGTTFTRTYTESPVCVPARAALLTGQLPHRMGVFDNDTPLAPDAPTFPRELTDAGYITQAIGKMHFNPTRTHHGIANLLLSEEIPDKFDEDDYLQDLVAAGYDHAFEPHGVRHELYYSPQPSQLPEHWTTTSWTGRRTRQFLAERATEPERPWFCFASFIKPHPPWDPPAPYYLHHDPLDMPDPIRTDAELERLDYHVRAQHRVKWTGPDERIDRIRTMRAYYYACVESVDAQIVSILDELEARGQREHTLVIFTADHGEYLGDHWAYGKRGFHDAAARIPLIMSAPGWIPAGKQVSALTGLTDIAATVLATAGFPDRLDSDGHDLAPLARGETEQVRDLHVGQYQQRELGLYFITDGEYKYIYSAPDHRETLLRVGSPQDDTVDLAGDPDYADVGTRLRKALIARLRSDGYEVPLDGDGWRTWDTPSLPGHPGDRDVAGRGRQYPRWVTSVPERPGGLH